MRSSAPTFLRLMTNWKCALAYTRAAEDGSLSCEKIAY